MNQKLDIQEIKEKILAKLEPSGWARVLKDFIHSADFDNIIVELAKQAKDGKRFTPTMKNWFRAFEECPYDELKVIIIGQDPYPGLGHADGISFSLSQTDDMQPSLKYLLNAVNKTVYDNAQVSTDKDLTRWANQGVLMLNTALTTNVGKIGQHYLIWKAFSAYLFNYLTWYNSGLIYVYLGKKAEEWAPAVNDNNYKFFVTHPAAASYTGSKEWDSKNVFVEIKDLLKKNNNFDIEW